MIEPAEYFRSVEAIWALWIGAVVALSLALRRLLSGTRASDWRRLAAAEEGAAYSLAYVLTFPLFMLLVCVIIECTLALVVKTGTVYAAYAAARSAIVWESAKPQLAELQVQRAAVNAMVPFASSDRRYAPASNSPGEASDYVRAYRKYANGPGSDAYLTAKYAYAASATRVSVSPSLGAAGAEEELAATVSYDMPFHIPGIGKVVAALGSGSAWFDKNVYTITSTIALQNEGPLGPEKSLGINYVSK
jgi:hypothetical protein